MSEIAGIDVTASDGLVYAAARGEIDMSNSRLIARDLTTAVPNDAHGLVLDLGGVDYLDSSAVQILFELAERLVARQQRLVFVVPAESRLHRMLTVVSLSDAAPIAASRAEAEALLA